MICSSCKQERDVLRSAVRNGVLLEDNCDGCLNSSTGFADKARAYEREWQQRHFAKDLVQRYDPEYVKAYGIDRAKENGWSDEDIRKYS